MSKLKAFSFVSFLSIFAVLSCNTASDPMDSSFSLNSTEDFKSSLSTASTYGSAVKTLEIKFKVGNGGAGLKNSKGIVSTQSDGYLVRDGDSTSKDFTITITVPAEDQYVNIRWYCNTMIENDLYLVAKKYVEGNGKYVIELDYNGNSNPRIDTKGTLRDVRIGTGQQAVDPYVRGSPTLESDFNNAWSRAIPD